MSDSIVFILGAGASREGGAPLMNDFLDVAQDVLNAGEAQTADAFRAVFEARSYLQRVHSKSELDIHNVEDVFAALEMARTLGRLGKYTEAELERLIGAMKTVIVETIQQRMRFPSVDGRVSAPTPYDEFVELLDGLYRRKPTPDITVVTFNYDVALDSALFFNGGAHAHYGLGDDPNRGRAVPVLKLHGSLNWIACDKCGVRAWHVHDYWPKCHFGRAPDEGLLATIGSEVQHLSHCDKKVAEPLIVPPVWSKVAYHRQLAGVWKQAAEALSKADTIIVIGYSLPESDAFFRYLYALGTVGEATLRRFWLFDPDPTGTVESRYRALLGPGARRRFKHFPETFGQAIGTLRSEWVASDASAVVAW